MLITVKQSKLVLGRTVYRKGDVFECRDAEAKLLIAGRMATKSADNAKATKTSPTAPTGLSTKPASPAVARARTRTPVKPIPPATTTAAKPTPAPAPAPTPAAKPVSALLQREPPQQAVPDAPKTQTGGPVGAMMQPEAPPEA